MAPTACPPRLPSSEPCGQSTWLHGSAASKSSCCSCAPNSVTRSPSRGFCGVKRESVPGVAAAGRGPGDQARRRRRAGAARPQAAGGAGLRRQWARRGQRRAAPGGAGRPHRRRQRRAGAGAGGRSAGASLRSPVEVAARRTGGIARRSSWRGSARQSTRRRARAGGVHCRRLTRNVQPQRARRLLARIIEIAADATSSEPLIVRATGTSVASAIAPRVIGPTQPQPIAKFQPPRARPRS